MGVGRGRENIYARMREKEEMQIKLYYNFALTPIRRNQDDMERLKALAALRSESCRTLIVKIRAIAFPLSNGFDISLATILTIDKVSMFPSQKFTSSKLSRHVQVSI